jgi:LPS-assembly protein
MTIGIFGFDRGLPPFLPAALTLALLHTQGAWAQQADGLAGPLILKPTPQLADVIAPPLRARLPSFVSGDLISGQPDIRTVVEGHASLRRGDMMIRADRLDYDHPEDRARATGEVRVNQAGNVYEGPELELRLESFEGFFNRVRFELLASGGHGQAERMDFVDRNISVAHQVSYTTCRAEDYPGWVPAWLLKAQTLTVDTEEDTGVASSARLSFMGLTMPPIPSMSFPLSGERKSGVLSPLIGMGSVSGIEVTAPYYWNIAPNRDATLSPTLMSKRGINLSTEFRYLENGYGGEMRADYMPNDRLSQRSRWGLWTQHRQSFDARSLGLDSLSGALNLNRVSDNDYWRDFTRTPSLTQRLLANEGSLRWSAGAWSGMARALSYQTLQHDLSPILPPYDRLPQLTADYGKYDWHGLDFSFNADYTRFRGNPDLQRQPNGDRVFGLATLSRPFITPGTFVIPKLMLNATGYQFEAPLAGGATSATRVVPTVSLDSGMVLERDAGYFGRTFLQTLEPRAFYVYTPYRNQSNLPNYDTAANDFNFATIYTENIFSGNDRIADNHLLTLGLTSRLIDPASGAEAVRLGVAQRLRFADQRVTLPGVAPATNRVSDLLMGAQINWTPKWGLSGTVQYSPAEGTSTRTAVTAHYSPEPYRTVNVGYRYQAPSTPTATDGSRSIDIGWQWPLNDLWGDRGKDLGPGRGQGGGRWYAVGRLNYSVQDRKLTDGVLGLEYDGCCWIGRVVLERITTGQITASTRIMFQLELTGLSHAGTTPLRTLTRNIQRYTPLRQPGQAPSWYGQYE